MRTSAHNVSDGTAVATSRWFRVLTHGLDIAEPEGGGQRDGHGNRAVCPPKLGSHALTISGRYPTPDAVFLVVRQRPSKTVPPNGTHGTDADGPGAAIRLVGKPKIRLVAQTQRGLAPRCRADVQFLFASGGIWSYHKGTRIMTPSISLASPGSGARWHGTPDGSAFPAKIVGDAFRERSATTIAREFCACWVFILPDAAGSSRSGVSSSVIRTKVVVSVGRDDARSRF
jgi:hypothetical protein